MPSSSSPQHRPCNPAAPLQNVKAILFDTFGTLVDWEGSVVRELQADAAAAGRAGGMAEAVGEGSGEGEEGKGEGKGKEGLEKVDWLEFTREWRRGYMKRTREIASGASGPGNIDDLHLEILNTILSPSSSLPYEAVADAWGEGKRKEMCQVWHRLDAWEDVKPGLEALRSLDPPVLLATLSNGTLKLLVDLARRSSLPLDAHFSGDLLRSYKPNAEMYLRSTALLGLDEAARERGEVALCAAHIGDLRAAKGHGLRTIYLRRETEDVGVEGGGKAVKPTTEEGGEVDLVLDGDAGGEGLRSLVGLLGR